MIKHGIFPTMVTPFDEAGNIDYESMDKFLHKFQNDGADGLFAVCQSSEMFNLTLEEKIALASYVKSNTGLQVIASGHTQLNAKDQIDAMKRMASSGVDAVVLISNAFAGKDDSDDVFIKNLEYFLNEFKEDIPLGLYECPYPYKRLVTEKTLKYIISTGRFVFLKDTSCDVATMGERLGIIGDSPFGLYNANIETLSATMRKGAAGFSGIHANVSTKLVKCLIEYPPDEHELGLKAQTLSEEFAEYLRNSFYPVSVKSMLKELGVFKTINTRVINPKLFNTQMLEEGIEFLNKIKEIEKDYDKEFKMRILR